MGLKYLVRLGLRGIFFCVCVEIDSVHIGRGRAVCLVTITKTVGKLFGTDTLFYS